LRRSSQENLAASDLRYPHWPFYSPERMICRRVSMIALRGTFPVRDSCDQT
jgi:hypothetical protein